MLHAAAVIWCRMTVMILERKSRLQCSTPQCRCMEPVNYWHEAWWQIECRYLRTSSKLHQQRRCGVSSGMQMLLQSGSATTHSHASAAQPAQWSAGGRTLPAHAGRSGSIASNHDAAMLLKSTAHARVLALYIATCCRPVHAGRRGRGCRAGCPASQRCWTPLWATWAATAPSIGAQLERAF